MQGAPPVERAREAFARHAWAEACLLFDAAGRETALDPEDLERLATAADLAGHDAVSESGWERAHHAFVARGDHEGAARTACRLAITLQQRGAMAPASGWYARAERILEDARLDSAVRGYLLIPSAIRHIVRGEPDTGHAVFGQAADVGRRFDDRDLVSFACAGSGRALIRLGRIREGIARLDEAMVAVVAGEVSPSAAGDIYCTVLEGCQEIFDLRRAHEWTTSLARWCAAQPELVRFRGECLLYRAEVLQLRGDWRAAARDAAAACDLLAGRPMAGAALYRVGEIHRLRGEFSQAERAYTGANERGRKPQPGLSQLRLAQGRIGDAAASIRSVLVDTRIAAARARILAAAVEILLAAGDLDGARAAAAELSDVAVAYDAPLLLAASAHATGAIHLADGDLARAAAALRDAWELWRDLEMPYDEAQTCVLLAAICGRRGDEDGRRLELDAARKLFRQLEAETCLARITEPSGRAPSGAAVPLSGREVQVLRLLATGRTNRDIGNELFISEKTVARHVSNIFDKLGVSSRTAATAWAYRHDLL